MSVLLTRSLRENYDELRATFSRPKRALHQLLTLGCVVFSALMAWKLLIVATGCETPVVVVLSGSMEPAIQRGDVLFLTQPREIHAGDIVVYSLGGRSVPIVHRALSVHADLDFEKYSLLTKGDANNVDDRGLYVDGQHWLDKASVMGVAQAYVPYIGMASIWINDYPLLKYALLGTMGLFVILGKE